MAEEKPSSREGFGLTAEDLSVALRKDVLSTLKATPRTLEELRMAHRAGGVPIRGEELGKLARSLGQEIGRRRAERQRRSREQSEELQRVVGERQRWIEASAKRKRLGIPAKKGYFVVAGRVSDNETQLGLPNVTVRAFDLDRKHDDPLGQARTDAFGYYRIEYEEKQFADPDGRPELYIQVVGAGEKILFTSTKSFFQKAGAVASIDAEVDGTQLPESRSLADGVNRTVDARLAALGERQRVMTGRLSLALKSSSLTAAKMPRLRRRRHVASAGGARRPSVPEKKPQPRRETKASEPPDGRGVAKKAAAKPRKSKKTPATRTGRTAKKGSKRAKGKAKPRKKKAPNG